MCPPARPHSALADEIRSLAQFPSREPQSGPADLRQTALVLYANQLALELLETMGWQTGQTHAR